MLYITDRIRDRMWHVGTPDPTTDLKGFAITFQADGDELDLILNAIREASSRKDKPES